MTSRIITIAIPVFNVGDWFEPCLNSIKMQSNQDVDFILSDDGSFDGSCEDCDCNTLIDNRFHVIHQSNTGVSGARNRALEIACGTWIWFIDADDIIHPDAIECLFRFMIGDDIDIIIFDFFHGKKISFDPIDFLNAKLDILEVDKIPEMSPWRCIFKRKVSENLRFENLIVGEDLLYCAKLTFNTKHIGYLPVQIYGYVNRETSVTNTVSYRKTFDSIKWMSRMLHFYQNSGQKHYKHLNKSRWNKFFWGIPYNIVEFDYQERMKLSRIWLDELLSLKLHTAPTYIRFLRPFYHITRAFSLARFAIVSWHAFVFRFYLNNLRG